MRIYLIVFLLALTGCNLVRKDHNDEERNWSVERLYSEAKKALTSRNYTKAAKYYEFMETRYPFGVYGQQAVLDLAFVKYKMEKYDEALSACKRFIRLYPQNPHVDYAYYLKGLVNFTKDRGLTDRILSIDRSQRDTSSIMDAFKDFAELGKKFPDSPYMKDARKRMVYLRNMLAEHEIHVADYYMRRGAFVAALNRARYIIENYPRSTSVPHALVIMAKSYKILNMDKLSEDTLRILQMNYPNNPGIAEVKETRIR